MLTESSPVIFDGNSLTQKNIKWELAGSRPSRESDNIHRSIV
jgi:hypothetical protein